MALTGCSSSAPATTEELLADMAEFTTPDGSVSMYFDKDWTEESMGIDSCVLVGEEDGSSGVILMQIPKNSPLFIVDSMDTLKDIMRDSYEVADEKSVEPTDTIRWFNVSYALLTDLNSWDYNRFGGVAANDTQAEVVQQLLDEWWGVTDRASADENLDWLLTEGHRVGFAENMESLAADGLSDVPAEERESYLTENYYITDDEAPGYAAAFAMYEQYGAGAIDGWDYCRAMNMPAYYYIAGYYTEQEALDKSLEIAQTIQPLFGSWDELLESYLRGYEYWAEESSDERRAVYEDIKGREDNPYAVDFKLSLEKTW